MSNSCFSLKHIYIHHSKYEYIVLILECTPEIDFT